MHLVLCIGWLESREGPFLGLREMVNRQLLPRYPATTVEYYSWGDDVIGALRRSHGNSHAAGQRPLILLGHSYGASSLVRAAAKCPDVSIDHLILLDPVPRWLWGQFQWSCYHLPKNIKAATCLYNPWSLPKSSPIRGGIERFINIKVSPLHASIPGDADVQSQVLDIIHRENQHAEQTLPQSETVKVPPVVRMGL